MFEMMRRRSSLIERFWAKPTTSVSVSLGLPSTDEDTILLRSLTSRARASLPPTRASLIFCMTLMPWTAA
ncbi:MAG: hypothetical protein CL908_00390 [Deltaproteobacteria bacterium]|nr:hypothetical protein [Deltaproteobacteria bacterium]